MPVVLLPVHLNHLLRPVETRSLVVHSVQRSVVLRPFITNDFMTGAPAVPGSDDMPLDVSDSIDFIDLMK